MTFKNIHSVIFHLLTDSILVEIFNSFQLFFHLWNYKIKVWSSFILLTINKSLSKQSCSIYSSTWYVVETSLSYAHQHLVIIVCKIFYFEKGKKVSFTVSLLLPVRRITSQVVIICIFFLKFWVHILCKFSNSCFHVFTYLIVKYVCVSVPVYTMHIFFI